MGRMTLWGMQQIRPTLLDGVTLPEGVDRDAFLDILNYRVGAQYPRTQVPPMLERLIARWFVLKKEAFQRMYDALSAEYNPIENYDRQERRTNKLTHSGSDTDTNALGTALTVKRTGTEEMSHTGSESRAQTGTETMHTTGTDVNATTGSESTEAQVSAYDASSYVPRELQTRTPTLTDTRTPDLTEERTPDLREVRTPDLTDIRTPDLTDVSENSGQDVRTTDYGHVEDVVEELRAHGNIGVTTNQDMVKAEVDMRAQYDLTDVIIGLFEQEFMSRVY